MYGKISYYIYIQYEKVLVLFFLLIHCEREGNVFRIYIHIQVIEVSDSLMLNYELALVFIFLVDGLKFIFSQEGQFLLREVAQ